MVCSGWLWQLEHAGLTGLALRVFLAVLDSLTLVQRVRSRTCKLVHCMEGDSVELLVLLNAMENCWEEMSISWSRE